MAMTVEECKSTLFKLGIKIGVSPNLISTRLLSKEDKQDMLNGLISIDSLVVAVKVWMSNGMPDYSNGKFDVYVPQKVKPMQRYTGIGKRI